MERIFFPSFDGEQISMLMEWPKLAAPAPCVVFLHGGAWRAGKACLNTKHVKYMASRGAVSASLEYRLATEGRSVRDCLGDCVSAMLFLRAQAQVLRILPGKICVCGESAGGHLALCLGTPGIVPQAEARPDFIVNFNGVVHLTGRFCHTLFGEHEKPPQTQEDWLREYRAGAVFSPLLQLGAGNAPTLHMHGLDDDGVPPYETAQMHDRLRQCGVESRLILLPGKGHSFIRFDYQLPNEEVWRCLEIAAAVLAEKGFLTEASRGA